MLISTTATSGFSSTAFCTASRPFAASPTTRQPRRELKTARAPRLTNPWSSTIRMRSFFMFVLPEGYHGPYRGALATGINLQPAADQFHPLLHTGDADTKFKPRLFFPSLFTGREAVANVANFQLEFRVTIHPYFGSVAS